MSAKHTFTLKGLRREIRRKVETGTGFHHVDDGHELADIELVVDLESIARSLGRKAMLNRRGKSSVLHGDVLAVVTRRQRVPA